jgi:hypothetical protein
MPCKSSLRVRECFRDGAEEIGVQVIRQGTEAYANDGSYTLYRTSETLCVHVGSQAREMVGGNGEVRRGRAAGQGENWMGSGRHGMRCWSK